MVPTCTPAMPPGLCRMCLKLLVTVRSLAISGLTSWIHAEPQSNHTERRVLIRPCSNSLHSLPRHAMSHGVSNWSDATKLHLGFRSRVKPVTFLRSTARGYHRSQNLMAQQPNVWTFHCDSNAHLPGPFCIFIPPTISVFRNARHVHSLLHNDQSAGCEVFVNSHHTDSASTRAQSVRQRTMAHRGVRTGTLGLHAANAGIAIRS